MSERSFGLSAEKGARGRESNLANNEREARPPEVVRALRAEENRERRMRQKRDRSAAQRRYRGRNSSSDLYVVETADLARIIVRSPLMIRMDDERAQGEGYRDTGARYWLATEVGVCVDVIRRIINGASRNTGLLMADDILGALDERDAFYDGRCPLYVNPLIRRGRWIQRAHRRDIEGPELEWLLHAHPSQWVNVSTARRLARVEAVRADSSGGGSLEKAA